MLDDAQKNLMTNHVIYSLILRCQFFKFLNELSQYMTYLLPNKSIVKHLTNALSGCKYMNFILTKTNKI